MSSPRATNWLLALIAFLLIVLIFDRSTPPLARADDSSIPGNFSGVEFISQPRQLGFIMFDRRTGGVWQYEIQSKGDFPLARTGPTQVIDHPGAEPRRIAEK